MAASPTDIKTLKPRRHLNLILIFTSITSCLISIAFLLWGLIIEGPAFYNGQECRMTYSQFQFLPIRVLPPSSSGEDDVEQIINSSRSSNRYRLLKFTDARDPRHQHLYKISGSMIENYDSQSNPKRRTRNVADEGRLLEFHDNWCLLPPNLAKSQWKDAPHSHRGHPVLYVPGHWGSFSQARSIGAHGTRWTGGSMNGDRSLYHIYNSFKTGEGMHDGTDLLANKTQEEFIAFLQSSYSKSYLDDFVMDVFSLDFDGGEGAALHSSKLFRQAEFFARAVETLVEGCQLSNTGDSSANDEVQGITIVAHSIGAWVVRIALKLHPHLTEKGWVKNVITLASPLSSVPYAVDAGVHDIVNHLNDEYRGNRDVTFISISGGLRDEMIPPESCEIPSAFEDRTIRAQGEMSTASVISEAFLATTIMKVDSDTDVDNQYGMDHRAIVWCYDLLKVVRKVIFTLVATTDQGITAPNRLNVANIVMLGRTSHKKTSPSFFRKETHQQWDQLVTDKGYARTTAIQLASPYNLNSLLKLTILSSMLDLHILAPLKRYWSVGKRRKEHATSSVGPYLTTLLDTTKSLFLIPLLVLSIFSTRRLSRSFWDSDDVSNCRSHECQVLLGTVFVLSQTSAMLYSFICLAVSSPALRGFFRRCSSMKKSNNTCSSEKDKPMGHSFGAIILQFIIQQARYLILCIVPSLTGGYYAFQHFVNGSENDLVWNEVSFSSYFFISVVVLVLSCLFKGLFISYDSNSQQECRVLFILLVSIVKATYGSVLYALSSTTHWGQMHSNLYNEFLNATKRTIVGYQNELFICLLKYLLPALLALDALLTYATMKQKARLQFSSAKDHGDDVLLYFKAIAKVDRERHIILEVVKSSLAMWYAWSVFESNSQDDIIIPAYSTITFVMYFLNSVPLSSAALDIFSAVD